MARFVVALSLVVLAAGAVVAHGQIIGEPPVTAPNPESPYPRDIVKDSYALGYGFGKGLLRRKVEVNLEELLAGLREGLAGEEGRMSDQEVIIRNRMVSNEATRRLEAERAELVTKNKAQAAAFLETNGKRPGVVSLPSGLQYEVLRQGDGPKPTVDDTVLVSYNCTTIEGAVVEASEPGEPKPVSVTTLPAWAEALPLMSVGSKFKLYVKTELGWGENERAANIPPAALLIYEIDLVGIEGREGEKAGG